MIELKKNNPNIPVNRIYPYRLEGSWNQTIDCSEEELKRLYEQIKKVLYVEEKPVRHGHWIQVDDTKCRCSECDVIALIALYPNGDKNCCPNCGAKMDEVE